MHPTFMTPYRAALGLMLVLLLGWATLVLAGERGGRGGGHGFQSGRGRALHGGGHGHRGGRFHSHHQSFRDHRGFTRHHGFHHHHGLHHHHGFHHHRGFHGKAFIGVAPLFLGSPSFAHTPPVFIYPPAVQPSYWYYCPSARAYYPHVATCPEPWIPVPAH